ncbi:hypothetical protein I6F35_28525 [Bradyrhizobium sp. BRP22]|uniref:hypothetical protein n=1 Tax=Bradyrhizobium sp. BRP22 TaxID=2793821 RepID=UPI001CD1CB76|nr:hypothetical protein [Bradyrhizobium sp. BRP22]MCA1457106.1 hypothetical protein [Bradyrhizobium sp. BRP22]
MDLQTLIANGIGIVGGFASLGGTFDKILTTNETRSKISAFLQRSRVTGERNLFAYIALVNETVFRRYFSSPFFSWRYFLTCTVVSLLSLLVILVAEVLAHGSAAFREIELDESQVLILAACIVVNIIVDWLSIGQTQVFFEISAQQTRLSRAVILIVADFILTINVFTMLYAQPIGLGAYLYGAIAQDDVRVSVSVTAREAEPNKEAEDVNSEEAQGSTARASERAKNYPYKISFDMTVKSSTDENEDLFAGSITADTNAPNISLADLLHLADRTVSATVLSSQQLMLLPTPDKLEKQQPLMQRFSAEWRKLTDKESAEEKEELTISFPWFGKPKSWEYAYTAAYQSVDSVQDSFPAILFMPLVSVSVDDLNRSYQSLLLSNETNLRGCGTRVNGQMRWEVRTDLTACDGTVEFSPANLVALRRAAQDANSGFSGKSIPLNILFMTSLSVTALLYAAAFFLLVARQFYQRVILGISAVEPVFLKSPLAVVGLIVGLAVFGTTLIF